MNHPIPALDPTAHRLPLTNPPQRPPRARPARAPRPHPQACKKEAPIMTYHDEVRDAMQDPSYSVRMRLGDGYLQALIDAIPPLTLKAEDGRFVKATESGTWTHEGITRRVFVVVEDPTQ